MFRDAIAYQRALAAQHRVTVRRAAAATVVRLRAIGDHSIAGLAFSWVAQQTKEHAHEEV